MCCVARERATGLWCALEGFLPHPRGHDPLLFYHSILTDEYAFAYDVIIFSLSLFLFLFLSFFLFLFLFLFLLFLSLFMNHSGKTFGGADFVRSILFVPFIPFVPFHSLCHVISCHIMLGGMLILSFSHASIHSFYTPLKTLALISSYTSH